jgi:NAD(P)-dependent dehydrogenase (short-subunit alcohol dehydrogenase family)
MNLSGAVVLVTGANRGIGTALVDAFLAAGVSRVYAAARDPKSLRRDPRIVPLELDITRPDQVAAAAQRAADTQILVNNAGVATMQPAVFPSDAQAADQEMRVNYFGTLAMIRAFAPVLAKQGGGAIVNVLSILSRVASPRLGSYSASKAAAFSLTQAARAELSPQGTLVIGVMPGFVDTDMAKGITLPKITPDQVAADAIEALRQGIEDVYPGPAADIAVALLQDPKALEKQFGARPPTPAAAD